MSKLTQRHRPNLSFSTISSPEISEQRRHPPVKNCHKSSTIFFVIATMATLILVVSFFYLLLPFPHQPELASDLPFKVFIQNLKTIRDDFPNQAKRFWATISATLSSILGKPTFPPQEPAVVIFLYRKSNDHQIKSSLERLVSRISRAVQEALQPNDPAEDPVLLRAESYRQESSNAAKKQLDLDINRVFATKTKFSVTLLDLHNLPSEVVTIFYGYCDTELAPYKNVAIFFTLAVEISSDDEEMEIANDFNRWDSLAHEELNKLWKEELNEDKRGPLLARIANSIVFFHP